jgi:hypothetical protein
MVIWYPVRGEDRLLNAVSAALVLLLLSLGFDVLKLPAKLAPGRPPWPQFVGLCCLVVLNAILMWTSARDDFLRRRYGVPRVAASLFLFTVAATAAMFLRGFWEGIYVLDLNGPTDPRVLLTVCIGGQLAMMLFMSAYFLKKTDSAPVREFKSADARAHAFLQSWLRGEMTDVPSFKNALAPVRADLQTLQEKVSSTVNLIAPGERQYARDVASLFAKVSALFGDVPEASVIRDARAFIRENGDDLEKVFGGAPWRRLKRGPRDGHS